MRIHVRPLVLIAALAAPLAAAGLDGLSQLGLTVDATKEAIGSIITAGVYNPGLPAKAFKALPPAARAQAVTAAAAWVKAYTATPEFKSQYTKVKESHKPEAPTWESTPEQEVQKAADQQKQQMEQSKAAIAQLPPDQRKALEEALKSAADMLAKMDTPDARKQRLDGIKMQRAEEMKQYQDAVAKWKQEYPDDPKPVVVKRLKEFLQVSADVDFNARLKTQDGASTFENADYQAKSSQWKMCYRAGKDATAAARAAAQAWLTELGG
jgi:hypothetical protein